MEHNIVINQAVLTPWVREINLKDAAIVGFIRRLSPNDPLIRHYMLNGYFRLDAGWIKRQLPMLDISEDWIRRSLKKLNTVGLIDCFSNAGRKKHLTTYGRVSLAYMEEEQRVDRAMEEAQARYAEKTPGTGENSRTRRKLPVSGKDPGESPIDHKKDQCKADSAPPPGGGGTSASEEKSSAAGDRFTAWLTARAGDPARGRAASARELLQGAPELPGINGPSSDVGSSE